MFCKQFSSVPILLLILKQDPVQNQAGEYYVVKYPELKRPHWEGRRQALLSAAIEKQNKPRGPFVMQSPLSFHTHLSNTQN